MTTKAVAAFCFAAGFILAAPTATAQAADCDGVREMPVATALWQNQEVREHFQAKPGLAAVFAANACSRKPIPLTEGQVELLLEDLEPPQAIYDAVHSANPPVAFDYVYATIFYEFVDQQKPTDQGQVLKSAPDQAAIDKLVQQLLAADPTQCFDDRERELAKVLLDDPDIKKYWVVDFVDDTRNVYAQQWCRELKKAGAPGGTDPAAVKLRLAAEEAELDWRGVVAAMAERAIKRAAR